MFSISLALRVANVPYGYSDAEIARQSNIPKGSLCRIKSGDNQLRVDHVESIAEVFKLELPDFFKLGMQPEPEANASE